MPFLKIPLDCLSTSDQLFPFWGRGNRDELLAIFLDLEVHGRDVVRKRNP